MLTVNVHYETKSPVEFYLIFNIDVLLTLLNYLEKDINCNNYIVCMSSRELTPKLIGVGNDFPKWLTSEKRIEIYNKD